MVSSKICSARVPSIEPAAPTPSKSSGTSRCSAVSSGVRRAAGRPELQLVALADAAGEVDQLAQRDAERGFVLAGLVTWPESEKMP